MLRRHNAYAVSVPLGAYGSTSETLGLAFGGAATLTCSLILACSSFKPCKRQRCDVFFVSPRKRVTLYTTCPWLKELGQVLDPTQRQLSQKNDWSSIVIHHLCFPGNDQLVFNVPGLTRERLQRVRSHLNLQIVRKYRDRRGRARVEPWLNPFQLKGVWSV